MSLDFDSLRKKLNTLQGQNNRSAALWKPSEGKTVIRILPWKDDPTNPFIELYFHYLGRKTQLSPITNGKADPIAEFADDLASTGDKDDWKHSRQFSPKLRTFVPVIVRGEEEKGVRYWGFGKTVYQALLGVISDPDYGDITDVQSGHDVGVEFIPEKQSETQFAQTKILVKPKETPLSADADELETWLDEQPDMSEIFDEPSYDELKVFLEKHLNPNGDSSVTATEKAPEVTESTEEAPVAETADDEDDDGGEGSTDPTDVTKEFDELFAS